ncbi:MAG: ABC transporter substrate-binding protein [Deltaproteobacteria bacterium]|nr:ABC transporter substrate-binding protein [Deltaproteobacteria bacterium]
MRRELHLTWPTGWLILVMMITMAWVGPAVAETGVTDKEIRIGQWGPQTGPAALWGAVARGTDCYFKMLNDEGGINGRQLKLYLRDDGYQPPRTKAAVKELVDQVGVFAFVGGVGTACGMAVKDFLAENKIPWIGPSTGSTNWTSPPSKYLFALYPNYVDEAAILTHYAVETMKKNKLAIFYQNDDYGKEGLKGVKAQLKKYNLDLLAEVPVEVMETDLSSHCLKLKESGADTVILWVLPKHAAMMLGASAKLGYKPQFMSSSTLSDAPMMNQITKGLWTGVIFTNFGLPPSSKNPLMVKYHAAQQKYAPSERWGVFFYAGFLFAEPLVEAIKKCGRDVTRENLISKLETLNKFEGISGPITFSPTRRQGLRSVFLGKCLPDSQVEVLSGWITSEMPL